MVRLLIQNNACEVILQAGVQKERENNAESPEDFKKPQVAALAGKYTPLHWASYNAKLRVAWLLLREGLSPLDIDRYGNTSVHQCCTNKEGINILECFLSQGIDIDLKNARGHTPYDLAASQDIKELIERAQLATNCDSCKQAFDFINIRYFCLNCRKFFCRNCCINAWVFEKVESTEKEQPVCYCTGCNDLIKKCEDKLHDGLNSIDFEVVEVIYQDISSKKVNLDVKLLHEMRMHHTKLEHEMKIRRFIDSLQQVDNYKTIKKSVKLLIDKLEEAKKEGIELSPQIMTEVNTTTRRLISERNLRFHMADCEVKDAEQKKLDKLEELSEKCEEVGVSKEYMEQATELGERMSGNLQARAILGKFEDYPEREYPVEEVIDPKKKAAPKKEEAKPKRKKKEPPFLYPSWGTELISVIKEVDTINGLLRKSETIELDEPFLEKINLQLARFKKEINFRKKMEEEERIAAELRKAAKEKAKKKK